MITENKIKSFIKYWSEMKEYHSQLEQERMAREYADLIEMGNLALAHLYHNEEEREFCRK